MDRSAVPAIADTGPEADTALADSARRELETYLTSPTSRLRSSLRWLPGRTRNVAAKDRGGPMRVDAGGAGSQDLLVLNAPLNPVPTVVDLFYLPHAFKLPLAHPALRDRQAAFDFVAFLLQLIEDDLAGRKISAIKLPTATASDIIARRRALKALLVDAGGIVHQMLQQLDSVYLSPSPALPTDPRQQLLWLAHQMALALNTVSAGEQPSQVIARLLADKPTLYAAARGHRHRAV